MPTFASTSEHVRTNVVGLKLNITYAVKLPGMQVLHAVMVRQQTLLFQIIWAVIFILAASLR